MKPLSFLPFRQFSFGAALLPAALSGLWLMAPRECQARESMEVDSRIIYKAAGTIPGSGEHTFGNNQREIFLGPASHVAVAGIFSDSFNPKVYYWHDGDISELVQRNAILPPNGAGYAPRVVLGYLFAGFDFMGRTAFQATLSCPDGSTSGLCDLPANFIGTPGSLTNYATVNWDEPKIGPQPLAINEQGVVAAVGRYHENGKLIEEVRVFPGINPNSNTVYAKTGWSLGTGAYEDFHAKYFNKLLLNETGTVFALVPTEDEEGQPLDREALFYTKGLINSGVLALENEEAPVPAAVAPRVWADVIDYKATTEERTVLWATVRIDNVSTPGLWFLSPTDRQLVALPGHTGFVNAGENEVISALFSSDYDIGRNGAVVFMAETSLGRRGIFRWQDGSLKALLIDGQAAPVYVGKTIPSISSRMYMNDRGDVVIPASISGVGTVLYLYETGEDEPRVAFRSGDSVLVDGVPRTCDVVTFHSGVLFNDQLQFVLELRVRDPFEYATFLLDLSRPRPNFTLENDDAVVLVTTIPGKVLGLRRTTNFIDYDVIATGLTGVGQTITIRDSGIRQIEDNAYYMVVIEGDLPEE